MKDKKTKKKYFPVAALWASWGTGNLNMALQSSGRKQRGSCGLLYAMSHGPASYSESGDLNLEGIKK
jgi:hypothetical protein